MSFVFLGPALQRVEEDQFEATTLSPRVRLINSEAIGAQ